MVRNRGHSLAEVAQDRIRMLVSFCKYMHQIQRNFQLHFATLARLEEVWEYKRLVDEHDNDLELPPKFKTAQKMRDTLDPVSYTHLTLPTICSV